MKYFVALFLLFAAVEVFGDLIHKSRSIRPVPKSKLRDVTNLVTDCGGPGNFTGFREEGCMEKDGKCVYVVTPVPEIQQLDFLASRDIEKLSIRITALNPHKVLVQGDIPGNKIIKGMEYTVNIEYIVEPDMAGVGGEATIELLNAVDNSVEICIRGYFEII